ncbi:MATE family efflux transporter [Labrenzia sp. VG12]|uniref:MATE family efflux transporter n=1 Tax=Labrenzia sp. VG12 TaxID=2021862 RepID=UPI000B8BE1E7|nr:MATE family efflux transporter [Labrenzia sp. VG12]ASP36276.1 MATE family efflux transporter [Labrenzia sp. VG12]
MSDDTSRANSFTHGPIGPTLLKTAGPIILVMSMNGFLTVADAVFLGIYVGPDALSAVTLMFPAYMLLAALATFVSSGMSSLLARHLGGTRFEEARAVFAGAHGLALTAGLGLILLLLLFGRMATLAAADGAVEIAGMSYVYLAITIGFSPLMFVLSVNSDALRNEGHVMLMAGLSLSVSLGNLALNYVLIALLGLGVAGSALGTVLAQALALVFLIGFRLKGHTVLSPRDVFANPLTSDWRAILALGAPQSLSFLGIALGSAATIAVLQRFAADGYEATVAAFGVTTRIMTFAYLPLLGLSMAFQTMIGNNAGAQLWQRTDATLRLGLGLAFGYSLALQALLTFGAPWIGLAFVDDADVIREVGRILPVMVAMYFAAGPLFVVATYFQALGDARRAALLSLVKPYAFLLPLLVLLPLGFGELGIWLAGPVAEGLLIGLTVVTLMEAARGGTARWGLFRATPAI